jgi:hypothetical protein
MDCCDRKHLLPPILSGKLLGADIPPGFLTESQTNYKFVVFETAAGFRRVEYAPRVKFSRLFLKPQRIDYIDASKVGGGPNWLIDNETPKSCGPDEMFFLLQLRQGLRFPLVPNAPRQMQLGRGGKIQPSPHDFYQLFLSYNIYMFGVKNRENPGVYVVTQI